MISLDEIVNINGTNKVEVLSGTHVLAKPSAVSKFDRARLKQHPAFVVWLTGLSGAGKSTLANLLEQNLYSRGLHTCLLDGDNLRLGLNKDLGFSEADRHENVRRVAEVAKLMVDAGNIVITAAISPFRSSRESARALFEPGEFIEVFVDVPLDVAEARDPKGLYALARQGEIKQFTGIGSGYEAPLAPDVHLSTATSTPEESLSALMRKLPLSNMPGQFINPMTTRVPLGSKETVCDTFRPPIVGI